MVAIPQSLPSTITAIDAALVRAARTGDSLGVSISQVINPCDRALWYAFRWSAQPEPAEGRRQRIFQTGEIYEARLLDWLEMIGVRVERVDPATGKQYRVELAHGQLRGKLDAIAVGLPEAPNETHAVECKSANDKSYKAITKGKIRDTKPEHFAQTQLYLHALGLRHGLYMVANKNDDSLHVERVAYDPAYCVGIIARIERIVDLDAPPARLHEDPNSKGAIECRWCPARAICHEGAPARRNCRTCLHSAVNDGARWTCTRHAQVRGYDDQQAGCPSHRYLPGFVPGEQIDADPETETVTYAMPDGTVWIDGGAAC